MARSSECTGWCASKVLDTTDIVRDAMFQQLQVLAPVLSQISGKATGSPELADLFKPFWYLEAELRF